MCGAPMLGRVASQVADAVTGTTTIKSADAKSEVANLIEAGGRGHVHVSTTYPSKEGATPAIFLAPATAKAAATGLGDHPDR